MDKTCSNCKNWSKLYRNRNGARCDVTEQGYTLPDMTCPRHEAKIEFPKWTPEWHPGSEMPKGCGWPQASVNVLAFTDEPVIAYKDHEMWIDYANNAEIKEPLYWCYLPEGWE